MKRVRIARVCPNLTAKVPCNWREFGDPKAVCPDHGRGVDQAKASGLGQHLSTPLFTLPTVPVVAGVE